MITNPNYYEAPEVFNGVDVGGLCGPNHIAYVHCDVEGVVKGEGERVLFYASTARLRYMVGHPKRDMSLRLQSVYLAAYVAFLSIVHQLMYARGLIFARGVCKNKFWIC